MRNPSPAINAKPSFFMMLIFEDDENDSVEAFFDQLQQQDNHTEEQTDLIQPQVRLYALDGHKNPRTLRSLGRISSTNIQVLIDVAAPTISLRLHCKTSGPTK